MKHISDEFYYNVCGPTLSLLVKRNHPDKTGYGLLHFDESTGKETGQVTILSFDCYVCNQFIKIPPYDPSTLDVVQMIRNHLVNDLKRKNLLPFI